MSGPKARVVPLRPPAHRAAPIRAGFPALGEVPGEIPPAPALRWLDLAALEPAPAGVLPPCLSSVAADRCVVSDRSTAPDRSAASGPIADAGPIADTDPEVELTARRIAAQIRSRQRLLDALTRNSLDSAEITELATADPVLAGEILRVVNSPFFGFRQPIGSVFRAVLLLGHLEVRNLVWRISCESGAGLLLSEASRERLEALWKHASEASRVAYALARSVHLPAPDSLATAALLHDVGKLLSLSAAPEAASRLWAPLRFSGHPILEAEADLLGITHDIRGGRAARKWELPEETCAAIEFHHAPSYVEPRGVAAHHRAIAVVHLADLLCHLAHGSGSGGDAASGPVHEPRDGWLALLGLREIRDLERFESVVRALRPLSAVA